MFLIKNLLVTPVLTLILVNTINTSFLLIFKLFFKNIFNIQTVTLKIGLLFLFLISNTILYCVEGFYIQLILQILVWNLFFFSFFNSRSENISYSYSVTSIALGLLVNFWINVCFVDNFYLIGGDFESVLDLKSGLILNFPKLFLISLVCLINSYLLIKYAEIKFESDFFKKLTYFLRKILIIFCMCTLVSYMLEFYLSFSIAEIVAFKKNIPTVFITVDGGNSFPDLHRITFYNLCCKMSLFILIYLILSVYNRITSSDITVNYFKAYILLLVAYYVTVYIILGKPLFLSTFLHSHGADFSGTDFEKLVDNYLFLLLTSFILSYFLFTVILIFIPLNWSYKIGLTLFKEILLFSFLNGFYYLVAYVFIGYDAYDPVLCPSLVQFFMYEFTLFKLGSTSFCMDDNQRNLINKLRKSEVSWWNRPVSNHAFNQIFKGLSFPESLTLDKKLEVDCLPSLRGASENSFKAGAFNFYAMLIPRNVYTDEIFARAFNQEELYKESSRDLRREVRLQSKTVNFDPRLCDRPLKDYHQALRSLGVSSVASRISSDPLVKTYASFTPHKDTIEFLEKSTMEPEVDKKLEALISCVTAKSPKN